MFALFILGYSSRFICKNFHILIQALTFSINFIILYLLYLINYLLLNLLHKK
jgi:hypothetical protein